MHNSAPVLLYLSFEQILSKNVCSLPHAESLGADVNQMYDPPNDDVRVTGHQIQLSLQYYNWVFKTKFF